MLKPFLEEDYEAHYKDGCRPDPFGRPEMIPVSLLHDMCHVVERMEREQTNRLHRYECKPQSKKYDKNLAIKEFKRSCVGGQYTKADQLRPWSVLKKTLHHLLLNICTLPDDWMYICDFVFDRLKAVRQDCVIQRIEGCRYIEILEGSVRFLVYSMYRLTCTLKDYSSSLREPKEVISNEGHVKGLNNYELNVVREMKLTMQCLRDCLNSLIVQYRENVPNSPHRALFEAINIIVNLPLLQGPSFTLSDFCREKFRNDNPMFKAVYKMLRLHLQLNYYGAMKELESLFDYPLIIVAYAPTLAQIQVDLVYRFKRAMSSAGPNKCSLSHLHNLLYPKFFEADKDEKLLFAQLMAVQFGIYDEDTGYCEFSKKFDNSKTRLPISEWERFEIEMAKDVSSREPGADNETRIYALQMIAGNDWSFFQDVIRIHGLDSILDPSQPRTLAKE